LFPFLYNLDVIGFDAPSFLPYPLLFTLLH
jgi:hypothetical protein